MNILRDEYEKETGQDWKTGIGQYNYILWLEDKVSNNKSDILKWIEKMFQYAETKEWYKIYFSIDVHGVISIPDHRYSYEINYYEYAKETLQLISQRDDIVMVLFTSSYPDEIESYMNIFKNDDINFKYVNENPEVSSKNGSFGYYDKKHYYSILADDKSGFDPTCWKELYEYFFTTSYRPKIEWKKN